jgi:hypothetical protein
MTKPAREISLEAPIENKISWARSWADVCKNDLPDNPLLGALFDRYKDAVSRSRSEMTASGMVEVCRCCEEEEGGSCCGAGLENRYNGILLLINFLLGVDIPEAHFDPESCFFLGPKGCRLIARHVICVNYICRKVTDNVDPEKILALRECEGVELETLFLLQENIKKHIAGFKNQKNPL